MINDQLTASVEKIGQRLFTIRRVERVGLFDFDPRQCAALPADFFALPSEKLFFLAASCAAQAILFPTPPCDRSFWF